MSQTKTLRPILFAVALSWLAGLGTAAIAATPPQGGYVGDLAGLTEISRSGFDAVFAKGGTLPKGFSSVYVAPVGVISGQDKTLDEMRPSDRKPMQDYLYDQLTKQLGKKFTLASKPGPGVLVVSAAFTALRSNKPTMSDLSKQPGTDYARSFGIGKAGIQIDLRDGASGELLAAFVDHQEGDPIDSNLNIHTQWGDVQHFSRDWAEAITQSLAG
ncbi:MAG: DUF3313 domain-containing protein [Alphaproteobacteria bacterium]